MSRFIFSMLLLLTALNSIASGWAGYSNIDVIHQRECTGDKNFEITLPIEHKNPDECTNLKSLNVSCDSVAFQTIASISLMALATGKQVDFWLNGCDSEGQAKVATIKIKSL